MNVEAILEQPAISRVITWETNFNNKLGNRAMSHVDIKPANTPARSELHQKVIEIRTSDNSYPPRLFYLNDMTFMPFVQVNDYIAWHSHGMTAFDFANYMFSKHHQRGFTWQTEIAIYFYLACL